MMRHTYFTTHWTPEEAHSIIQFLDELREILMHTYGNDIHDAMYRQRMQQQHAKPFADTSDEPPF